ncbi:MAG: hypothetical protein ISR76_09620 [Planctomycetes bacterium]|nr:hypothetical protein [Planctomycetota bacterium]MBL7009245.1 hypothetical protein [Planctomycetota bacterium]
MRPTRSLLFLTGIAALVFAPAVALRSQDPQPVAAAWKKADSAAHAAMLASKEAYLGSKSCKMCHNKAETGDSYDCWENSGHAKAFETLKGEAAKKIAAELGLKDAAKAPECLKCHVTGAAFLGDEERFGKKFSLEDGVGCESCHGPAGGHIDGRKAAKATKVPTDRLPELPPGELVVPDLALCSQCHNDESPTYEAFDPEKMLKAIAHLHPLREKPRVSPPKKKESEK